MKSQKKFLRSLILCSLLLLIGACSNDNDDDGIIDDPKEIFNNALTSLSDFNQPQELQEPEVEMGEAKPDQDDSSLECFTTFYKAAPGFDEMLALDPTSDVIFPGAMLKGESIPTGEYIPIIADRSKITLSASLTNINGSPVVEITDPKLSTVREGIKSILDQEVTGATSASLNFEISEVYSKEQLSLAIGANYRSAASKVSSSFNFESSTYAHKYVLKYLQVYYTIDMDPPKNPSDLFTDVPDISSLGSTSPVYVSTVTYGRMIIYTIESNYSRMDIDAAFSQSFGSNDGSIDVQYEKVINESSIKALVIGGSGDDAAKVVNGPADVYAYISDGGNYSRESPGAPLSYKLRYLRQGTPVAKVVLASEYTIRQCDLVFPIFRIELDYIECKGCDDGTAGDNIELYGRLTATLMHQGRQAGKKVVWDYEAKEAWKIGLNERRQVNRTVAPIQLNRPDYDVDHVAIGGHLYEADDFSADDDLGPSPDKIYLKDIPFDTEGVSEEAATFVVEFLGGVSVGFVLQRLK